MTLYKHSYNGKILWPQTKSLVTIG